MCAVCPVVLQVKKGLFIHVVGPGPGGHRGTAQLDLCVNYR